MNRYIATNVETGEQTTFDLLRGGSISVVGTPLNAEKLNEIGKELSEKYNIPSGTIKTWTSKLNHPEKYIGQGQKRGRKKEANLTKEDWKERYEILKKYQAFLKAQRERK